MKVNQTKEEKMVDNFLMGWRRIQKVNKRLRKQKKNLYQRKK